MEVASFSGETLLTQVGKGSSQEKKSSNKFGLENLLWECLGDSKWQKNQSHFGDSC